MPLPPASLSPPELWSVTRRALAGFAADGVQAPIGRAAHERGDLHGVGRSLPAGDRLSTLVWLFLLGKPVGELDVRSAFGSWDPTLLPLLEAGAGSVRATVEVRPYAQEEVTTTDISARALRMAATTAALSGVRWDLRQGSLFEPVWTQLLDPIMANPPFVVSPGGDPGPAATPIATAGLAGDGVSAAPVRGVPALLAQGASASLVANWSIDSTGEWEARLHGRLARTGCDAWVWQREVADPGGFVSMWLRDAGEIPGGSRWARSYDEWLHWFGMNGWDTLLWQLRLSSALWWEIEADEAVTGLVAACNAALPLERMLGLLAAALDRRVEEVSAGLLPVVRDLIARGFLDIARPDESPR